MATSFGHGTDGPEYIRADPQKEAPPEKSLKPGLEHRPFTDGEIKTAFETFDLDKNRFVGVAEIKHILGIIGEEVTDVEIDEMIGMCDSDGDGQVTFDEFYKMMTQPPPLPPPPPPPQMKAKSRKTHGAAENRYYRSATAQLDNVKPTDAVGLAALDAKNKAATRKKGIVSQQQIAQMESEKKASDRGKSVEGLVTKLSGGIGKIKPSQIKKVYKRFQEIDVDGSGSIDYTEFIQALGMEDNTISKQMFRVFDMDGSGTIELKEFIVVLSRYTTAAKTEKLKFAFMMFDEDGSGLIERSELIQMLGASFVVEGYAQEELEDKADAVFDFLNIQRDGAVSYEQFLKLSSAKNGLIYPIEEGRHNLGNDVSLDALVNENDSDADQQQ